MSSKVSLEVAELHPDSIRSSCSLSPAATSASSSSGESISRSASITFSRASSRDRPWVSAPGTSTSTSARETTFRPAVIIADQQTLVMCDQLDTVDPHRLTEAVGFLGIEEIQRVDEALALVLDLRSTMSLDAMGAAAAAGHRRCIRALGPTWLE